MEESAYQGSTRVAVDFVEVEFGEPVVVNLNGPVEVSGQPQKPSCETCRFWAAGKDERVGGQTGDWEGECRRFPPTVFLLEDGMELFSKELSPNSYYDHWCGEYEKSLTPPPDPVA